MITFYVTSHYWEGDSADILDYTKMSEQDIAQFINNHPNSLVMIQASSVDCVFRSKFIEKTLDEYGFVIEGEYQAKINHGIVKYRLLNNINSYYARQNSEKFKL